MAVISLSLSRDEIALITVTLVFGFLAITAVVLRIWSRRLLGKRLALDDYLSLASLAVFLPSVPIIVFSVIYRGSGNDPTALSLLELKMSYMAQFFFGASCASIKLSLLAFYWRVFPTRRIRISIYVLGFCCAGWFFAVVVVGLVGCKPISYFWDQTGDGSCIDMFRYLKYQALVNVLIDIFTIVLPIHEVVRLQMSTSRKAAIISVFLLGSIVIVASTVRFVVTVLFYTEPMTEVGVSRQYALMGAASAAEVFFAIIGSCGITLGPAYKHLRYGPNGTGKSHASAGQHGAQIWSDGTKTIGRLTARASGRSSLEMLEQDGAGSQTQIVTEAQHEEGGDLERNDVPLNVVMGERAPSTYISTSV